MFDLLKARKNHGYQAVPDLKKATVIDAFRGFPLIKQTIDSAVEASVAICPAKAVLKNPLRIDLGRCVFCGKCENASAGGIKFSSFHKISSTKRDFLIVDGSIDEGAAFQKAAVETRKEIKSIFGRSLKLRSVSAGGCNACEYELNACGNVNFDMGRFGIEMVASPRHADGIIISGPLTANMSDALFDTYAAVPEPKIVVALGACAISGGIFDGSPALNRSFFEKTRVDLFIPGCPPHPLTVINGILDFIGRK